MLVCPKTHTRLSVSSDGTEMISMAAKLAYPIRHGIPILLIEEARLLDEHLPQDNQAQSK